MIAGQDDHVGPAPGQQEPVGKRCARLAAVQGRRRPAIRILIGEDQVVQHDEPPHERPIDRRAGRRGRAQRHGAGHDRGKLVERRPGHALVVARIQFAHHHGRVVRRTAGGPTRRGQRQRRRVADAETGHQRLQLLVDRNLQRLERQIPEETVRHDRQLVERLGEIGQRPLQ